MLFMYPNISLIFSILIEFELFPLLLSLYLDSFASLQITVLARVMCHDLRCCLLFAGFNVAKSLCESI